MSLRDQLQKTGLLSKEKMKQAERAAAKNKHKTDVDMRQRKSDELLLKAELSAIEERRREQLELAEAKRKKDEELIDTQMADIITRGELKDPTAKGSYYFTLADGQIESITVNEIRSLQLAAGECAIAFLPSENRYVLISSKNAEKIINHRPKLVACYHKLR